MRRLPGIGTNKSSSGGGCAIRCCSAMYCTSASSVGRLASTPQGQGSPLDDMYNSKEQCRQDTAPLHVPPHEYPPHIFFCIDPTDQAWYRGNDRLHEKLIALGIPHEIDFTTRAGGHSWDYFNHMAERVVRFLVAGLEQESRRLL